MRHKYKSKSTFSIKYFTMCQRSLSCPIIFTNYRLHCHSCVAYEVIFIQWILRGYFILNSKRFILYLYKEVFEDWRKRLLIRPLKIQQRSHLWNIYRKIRNVSYTYTLRTKTHWIFLLIVILDLNLCICLSEAFGKYKTCYYNSDCNPQATRLG